MSLPTDQEIMHGLVALLGPDTGFILLVQNGDGIECVSTMPPQRMGRILADAAQKIADGELRREQRVETRKH